MTPNPENEPDQTPKDLPDVLAEACGRYGLNDEEIKAVQADVLSAVETRLQDDEKARKAERDAILSELKDAWGTEAEAALDAASFAAQSFGLDDEDVEDLLDAGDPKRIIPALARVGLALKELDDDDAKGELHGQGARLTPEAAQAELSRLTADKDHREAFLNRAHPNHQAVLAQRAKLLAVTGGAGGAARG